MSPVDFRMEVHIERAIDVVDRLEDEANERAARRLLELAQPNVPRDTGELEASAAIETDDEGAAVGYLAEHARYVAAHPEWRFQDGRSGRWLEEAADDQRAEIGDVYSETFRSGWPG